MKCPLCKARERDEDVRSEIQMVATGKIPWDHLCLPCGDSLKWQPNRCGKWLPYYKRKPVSVPPLAITRNEVLTRVNDCMAVRFFDGQDYPEFSVYSWNHRNDLVSAPSRFEIEKLILDEKHYWPEFEIEYDPKHWNWRNPLLPRGLLCMFPPRRS